MDAGLGVGIEGGVGEVGGVREICGGVSSRPVPRASVKRKKRKE